MTAVLNESGPDAGVPWHYGDPLREQRRLEAGQAAVEEDCEAIVVDGGVPGDHVEVVVEDENSAAHYFTADLPGYRGASTGESITFGSCLLMENVEWEPGSGTSWAKMKFKLRSASAPTMATY